MTAPLILALFAAAATFFGPRHLLRAGWVLGSPTWGIWAWQALTLATMLSVALIGLTLALPVLPVGPQLGALVRTTHLEVVDHYETPAGNWLATTALTASVVLATRAGFMFVRNLRRAARQRRQQLDGLQLIGDPHPGGFMMIEHSLPLVYCLPGRGRAVVVTSGALDALSDRELESVLAHERTHLRARHDVALALSEALNQTFKGLPLFRIAHEQVGILVEMQADDAARDKESRRAMASALVTLGTTVRPTPAPPDTVNSSVTRIHRLTGSPVGVRPRQQAAVGACTLAILVAPLALAVAPAIEATTRDCCHIAIPKGPARN